MADHMTADIGILSIHAYVPEGRLDVVTEAERFGATADFVHDKLGFSTLSRRAPEQETSDLAQQAIQAALDVHPGLDTALGLLIVVTQTPDGRGLPHVSAMLQGRLGLPNTLAAFDLSLGCSGWVYALGVAKSFMEAHGIAFGLVVTADPYSKIVDPEDRNTALLFGDAATATVLGPDPAWAIGHFTFATEGKHARDLMVGADNRLAMNGRAVFTFTATQVPLCVTNTLAKNGLTTADLDLLILHQASRYIVTTIGERLNIADKVPFLAARTGNTVSSSIPLALLDDACAPAKTIAVCGFGVGLSMAATLLSRPIEKGSSQ